ncbi:S-adenosyl-L-methionine-dependent methyltransferase [Heliocybe sulcata]|uniref:S-adenosyl-L-methionine-dependent methyltransferase n=1 Tax=Heliocybe sulcata TaxID=5364 RepID=A0A5C3NFW0_9AGAM|nr:S-adenosyl-L-methionine-dependent methyltransferase [Heliocybe sulcata]
MQTLSAPEIASLSLHHSYMELQVQVGQTKHRIDLLHKWDIPEGSKVLEIGCGQGDCTAALAEAVGPTGHVTGVDPGSLTYGSPYNLGQAQAHLSAGRLGSRITWVQADPLDFLSSISEPYDVAVLAHSLWYFSSPVLIRDTLRLLARKAKKVCIAEWSLSYTAAEAGAHVLAALTQAGLECHKNVSTSNVRTVVSPKAIQRLAGVAGLELIEEGLVTPDEDMYDGKWEVERVLDPAFVKQVNNCIKDEKERAVVMANRDAVEAIYKRCKQEGKLIASMDVWWGVFKGGVCKGRRISVYFSNLM